LVRWKIYRMPVCANLSEIIGINKAKTLPASDFSKKKQGC
jgi:hypothetical protein